MTERGPHQSRKKPSLSKLILKAIQDGNYEELNLLLKPGLHVNPECFFTASEKHGWKMVQILLEIDASGVHVKNEKGQTLLMLHINNIVAVRYLLDHGAHILFEYYLNNGESIEQNVKESVLEYALQENPQNVRIIRLLLKKGAINSSENAGYIARAALELAVTHPQANVEIVQLIFKYGPALSDYRYPRYDDETALSHALDHYQPNIKIMRVLIQNGADVNLLTANAADHKFHPNALRYAVTRAQSCKKEILQFFTEEIGMDPFFNDAFRLNVFKMYFKRYACYLYNNMTLRRNADGEMTGLDPFGEEMTKFREEKNEALEYLLRLPQFQQYKGEHPQSIYLRNWAQIPMFEMPAVLLSPEFKQTNLISRGFILRPYPFMTSIHYQRGLINSLINLEDIIYFSPVSLCVNSLTHSYYGNAQTYILKFLESLVENGFRVDEPGSISPLTLVFFKYMTRILKVNISEENTIFKFVTQGGKVGEEVKSELIDLTKFLIEKDAHAGQSILTFPANASRFETLHRDLCLPDAVYAAFESACFFCLPLVLPYFAQPPLALLLLTEFNQTALVNSSFPILCKGGPIPPGSRYLNDLNSHLQRMNAELKIDHVYNKFMEMHSSPPTLLHLSRCVIRTSCAERASQPGESLPKLMRSFEIPVELKDYLEMPPPKRLDAFYCDDPIMAQLANEQLEQLERELEPRYY